MLLTRAFRHIQRLDWWLLASVIGLFAFGLAAIYSVELSRESSDFLFIKKQLLAFAIGTGFLVILSRTNALFLRSFGRVLYIFGVLLMIAVLIFGTEVRGTTGWFIVGGFSFQPVEFMKLALAVVLARYFSEKARRKFGWRELFGSFLLTAAPAALTLLQPDVGSASVLLGIWFVVIFFAGLRIRHALALALIAVLVTTLSWSFLLQDYQKERIQVFMSPLEDLQGSGYNVAQARIAIGSGQLFGRGLGFGSQSQLKFLPESQTDFIFAVVAEELGFFGVSLVLAGIGIMLWRILRLARLARDHFITFLVLGLFGSFAVQAVVNISVNLALFPATGIALPLMSYGGSSLLISLIMIGIIEGVAVQIPAASRVESVLG